MWSLMSLALAGEPGEWEISTPAAEGMDPAAVAAAMDYAFGRTGDDVDRLGIRTDGLVVVRNGRIVAERYARGYDEAMPHLAWSVSKSVTQILVGAAVLEGRLDPTAPASQYYPGLSRPETADLRVQHLLDMSTGLYWNEGYEGSPIRSRVLQMLYTRGRGDMAAFTASQSLLDPPGSTWAYSSGTTNLLMGVLRGALGEADYHRWPWTRLFDPLGMENVTFERDASGTFVGSSYWYASARDQARFGQLVLEDGVWAGRRLVPEGWIAAATRTNPSWLSMPATEGMEMESPGAHWWTNTGNPERGIPPVWPSVPVDAFAARGHWGQSIVVVPSLDLVVVRTGDDRNHDFSVDTFFARLLAGAPPAGPGPVSTFDEPLAKAHRAPSKKGDLGAFPSIISAYYAKEMCSCLWVVGQPEEACHQWVSQYIPIQEARVNEAARRVTVAGLGRVSQARWVSDDYGCVLEP